MWWLSCGLRLDDWRRRAAFALLLAGIGCLWLTVSLHGDNPTTEASTTPSTTQPDEKLLQEYLQLLVAADNQDDNERTIEYSSRLLELGYVDADVLFMRAGAFSRQSQFDVALPIYDRAVALRPTWDWGYVLRASTLAAAGMLDKAIEDYTTALQLGPAEEHIPFIFSQRGAAYRRLGQREQADADIRKARELSEKSPPATPADQGDQPTTSNSR